MPASYYQLYSLLYCVKKMQFTLQPSAMSQKVVCFKKIFGYYPQKVKLKILHQNFCLSKKEVFTDHPKDRLDGPSCLNPYIHLSDDLTAYQAKMNVQIKMYHSLPLWCLNYLAELSAVLPPLLSKFMKARNALFRIFKGYSCYLFI